MIAVRPHQSADVVVSRIISSAASQRGDLAVGNNEGCVRTRANYNIIIMCTYDIYICVILLSNVCMCVRLPPAHAMTATTVGRGYTRNINLNLCARGNSRQALGTRVLRDDVCRRRYTRRALPSSRVARARARLKRTTSSDGHARAAALPVGLTVTVGGSGVPGGVEWTPVFARPPPPPTLPGERGPRTAGAERSQWRRRRPYNNNICV